MKIADVRAKSDDELIGQITDLKKAQYNLRIQKSTGQLEKTAEIRTIRRSIARVKTVLTERKLGMKVESKVEPKKTAKAAKPAAKKTTAKKPATKAASKAKKD